MSSLIVKSPGLLTTLQDLGRPGFGAIGVSAAGAADPVALRLANLLVGNEPGAAALEMTLLGGTYVFPEGGVIAVTGANMNPTLNGQPLEMWVTTTVTSGSELALGPTKNYARSYLAVAGGFKVKAFLGSASTHLLSGTGGFQGRALRKGDVLKFGPPQHKIRARRLSPSFLTSLKPRKVLRVTDGPQADLFSQEARHAFSHQCFRVSEESDRLGLRLEGSPIPAPSPTRMITEGVSLGAIQITPSGQAIILGVDQQTTGGYPKIANVVGVDLHRVGQLRPHLDIRFERTSLAVARALWIERERLFSSAEHLLV
ncbi:MAG TPA: biotin-dependent carboxyltransferase family protein [Methylomirabilota bacterium]|nr:biotin-dependent carboxyltransferase family protein [Methylomirabilota bacterium]